jgi:hypothetical protein
MRVTPLDDGYVQVEASANGCAVSVVIRADLGPFTAEGFVKGDEGNWVPQTAQAGVLIRCADGTVAAWSSERIGHLTGT